MTTPVDFGACAAVEPHARRTKPRPHRTPGPGAYDVLNTPTDVTTKFRRSGGNKVGLAVRFRKNAHDTLSPGPGVYALNPAVGDQTLSTKKSAGRVTFNMGKRGSRKRYQGSLVHAYTNPNSSLGTKSASAFGASTADRFAQNKRDILASCSPGPGSAWTSMPSTLVTKGGATVGTSRRFMNDRKLSADASANQSVVGSVSEELSFYEKDHARPGPGAYSLPSTTGKQPISTMKSPTVPVFTTGTRAAKPIERTPGPSDYEGRTSLGRQPSSKLRSEPSCRFGAAARPALMNPVG